MNGVGCSSITSLDRSGPAERVALKSSRARVARGADSAPRTSAARITRDWPASERVIDSRRRKKRRVFKGRAVFRVGCKQASGERARRRAMITANRAAPVYCALITQPGRVRPTRHLASSPPFFARRAARPPISHATPGAPVKYQYAECVKFKTPGKNVSFVASAREQEASLRCCCSFTSRRATCCVWGPASASYVSFVVVRALSHAKARPLFLYAQTELSHLYCIYITSYILNSWS